MAQPAPPISSPSNTTPGAAARVKGDKLLRKGQIAEAVSAYETAVQLDPTDTAALFALAATADRIGHEAAAIGFYERVLAQEPARLEAIVNLSNAYRAAGRGAEAIALLRRSIEASPERAALWLSLGNALREDDDRANARLFFEEALRLQPDYPQALGNLADLDWEDGDTDQALARYARAIKKAPKLSAIRRSYALALLQLGRLTAGWSEYEHRFKTGKPIAYSHGLKRWRGEPLKDKALLVTAEQGIGDQIMFAGALPDLLERIAPHDTRVLMDCDARLVPLMQRSFPSLSVHATHIEETGGAITAQYPWLAQAGGAARACPIGSLPAQIWPTPPPAPSLSAYLTPDPDRVRHWQDWLAQLPDGPKIGICWRSGKTTGTRNNHYAPLEHWALAMTAPGAVFIDVQYDARDEERQFLARQADSPLHTPPGINQKQDLDDACALLSTLDYVVSAPTAVAYQAAAVGTPVLRLVPAPSWTRLGRPFDAFAPLCEDVVCDTPGDWAPAFETVRRHVRALAIGR